MKDKTPVLEVKNLNKKFGDFTAVSDVSFSLAEGHILGYLGPNGAGKSTTAFCILGLIEPTSGQINIFGKDVTKHRTEVLQQMNFASAEYQLPWNLTVSENLKVFSKLYSISDAKDRINDLLDIFEISHLRNKLLRQLSLGQRARISLAKAFINKPRLLLLDEPMASMDPAVVDKGIKIIRKLQEEEKITILYTSHNMWEVEEIANEIVFINHGKIVAQGSALELTREVVDLQAKEPNLREVFIEISRKEKFDESEEEE